jgi:hypothetical protein
MAVTVKKKPVAAKIEAPVPETPFTLQVAPLLASGRGQQL